MSKLTDEQIEQSAEAHQNKAHENLDYILAWKDLRDVEKASMRTCMIAAAPYLQMPWDEPSEKDFADARSNAGYVLKFVVEWVRRRNAALLPKPIDPRREKVVKSLKTIKDFGLMGGGMMSEACANSFADEILAALDEVK